MARLGRQRREAARISRGRPITTPTPLVRRQLVQTQSRRPIVRARWARPRPRLLNRPRSSALVSVRNVVLVSRAAARAAAVRPHLRRHPLLSRGRSVTTATPLIRKRLLQVQSTRPSVRARWGRQRSRLINRPRSGALVSVRSVVLVSRAAARGAEVRPHLRRHPLLSRGLRTAATATPLVRKRLLQVQSTRPIMRARWARQRSRLINRSRGGPVPAPVRASVLVSRARRLRHRLRSPLIVQPAVSVLRARPPRLVVARRRLRLRGRRRPWVSAAIAQPVRPRLALARRHRPAARSRRHATLLRAAPRPGPSTRTTSRLVVVRNRRAASLRTAYARHRMRLETSTLGTDRPPVFIVAGFDASSAAENLLSSPTAGSFDTPSASVEEHGAPAAQTFDSPSPHF